MSHEKLDVQNHFEKFAVQWDQAAHRGAHGAYPLADERKNVIFGLMTDVAAHARVLDLGCGPGVLLADIARRGHECVGVDFAEAMLALAEINTSEMEKCTVIKQDIDAFLNFCQPFDVIIAAGVIYYQADILKTLKLIAAALDESGTAIVSFRHKSFRRSSDAFAEQVHALSQGLPPHEWKGWLIEFSQELSQIISTHRSQRVNTEHINNQQTLQTPGTEPQLDLPSHTIEEIHELARHAGLYAVEVRGVHPHLLHPAFDKDELQESVDRMSRRLSSLIEPALVWFTHVVVKFERIQ